MSESKDRIIGGFKVLQEIQAGSGSQGTVYKAQCVEDIHGVAPVGTVVAMKVMAVQDDTRELWRKLEKRTKELCKLEHQNVVKYYGCFAEQGAFNDVHVVVQEFLSGETLKERLMRFPSGLDADEALRITDDALAGLEYTAGCGLVHRDVKPGNIFVCLDENGAVAGVKLIDFEIAKQEGGTVTTAAGNIRGSFDYMAPDFTNPEFHGDVQSDVFSMGVVLHEALTGKTPYQRLEGDDKQANFAFLSRWGSQQDGSSPIHVSSRVKRILSKADEVIEKALSPDRNERFAGFGEFRAALKTIKFRDLVNGDHSYRMLQFIGKGGFGEVFKARFRQTNSLVAVKHLLKADYADRFNREAKIMKKLRDPCFVQFVDFFVLDSRGGKEAFLVMAFLDGMPGSSLRDAIKESKGSPLPFADSLRAFERYARGLATMHAEGIFHRDIKPANLYYPPGKPHLAAIMDLGIARDVNGTATHGMVPGTLDYMPPEVVLSDNRGDGGMDVYALGLCLYEAITGRTGYPRLPTGTASYAAFFSRAKARQTPVFDHPMLDQMPELKELLRDMTELDPSKRLKDASVVAAKLREIRSKYNGIELADIDEPETSPTEWIGVDEKKIRSERRKLKAKKFFKAAGFVAVIAGILGVGGYFALPYIQELLSQQSPDESVATTAPAVDEDAAKQLAELQAQIEKQKAELERQRKEAEEAEKARREKEAEERRLAEEKFKAEQELLKKQLEEQKKKEIAEAAEKARKAAEEEAARKAEQARKEAEAAEKLRLAKDKSERERIEREEQERKAKEAAEEAERKRQAEEEARRQEEERLRQEELKRQEEQAKELAALKAQLAAAQKAKEEAEAAAKKAEEERIAAEKAEQERLAKEEAQLKEEAAKRQKELEEQIRKEQEEARQKAIAEARAKAAREAAEAERKRIEQERLAKEKEATQEGRMLAVEASDRYDLEDYKTSIELYTKALEAGYAPTKSDMAKIQKAFDVEQRNLKKLIDSSQRKVDKGIKLTFPIQDLKDERSTLIERYNRLKKAARGS